MLRFYKIPGHDLLKAGTMHSLSCTTANSCQKVDNSDQISSKSKLFEKAPTVGSKQARSKNEEKMKEAEKRGEGKSKNNGKFAHTEQCHTRPTRCHIRNAAKIKFATSRKKRSGVVE